jgi:FAD/FMN-containing dehydrogenase
MNTHANTTNAGTVALTDEQIRDLRGRLRGPLLLPGEPGYDESRSVWNAMIDRRPALVVRCLGVADVVACVNFARSHDLGLSIKGGGHNIAGLAVGQDTLMLDLCSMRGVWVDPVARTARAQAGCLLGDIDRETQLHGLAAVLGFVSNTGAAGLTLGGGFGYLTRRYGWSSDTVRSMEVVTADGRIVRASDSENADLFWGLRGGGGNFGIVTQFEYQLHPIGPEITAGLVAWSGDDAPEVLGMLRELAGRAPAELTCVGILRIAPPAPWLAPGIHGKPIVAIAFCHTGAVDEGERLAASVKSFGKPVGDILQRRTYVSQQSVLDATQPKGRRYYWKSEYLPKLDAEITDKAIEHWNRIVSPHSAILLFQIGGCLDRLPKDHSPVGNRDAQWVLNIAASWEQAADDERNIAWSRTGWSDMRRFSTGGTYVNFLTEEEGVDRIRAAYGDNYARLTATKKKWDPENRFRVNKNVNPTS